MKNGRLKLLLFLGAFCGVAALTTPELRGQQSIARIWNEQNLAAIRIDFPNPPVHARNLFHTSVAMWDAWAAYDSTAVGYLHRESATANDIAAARHEAISYAAYRLLAHRYALSVNAPTTLAALNAAPWKSRAPWSPRAIARW